jgi:hypothetical protein
MEERYQAFFLLLVNSWTQLKSQCFSVKAVSSACYNGSRQRDVSSRDALLLLALKEQMATSWGGPGREYQIAPTCENGPHFAGSKKQQPQSYSYKTPNPVSIQ